VVVLIPTSGTTGRSKLVMQTHVAYVMAGEGFPFWMQLSADDRLMTSLPLFHINAPAYSTLGSVAARASLVLLSGFSAGGFLDAARHYEATEFNAIGAMLEILMRNKGRVITRTMLLREVWDLQFDPKTTIVQTNISRLRDKIDRPGQIPLIQTVRGVGYRIDEPH
jgi:acyl-CoA synthetase (AMP-forming)/AMP-acid ligase II